MKKKGLAMKKRFFLHLYTVVALSFSLVIAVPLRADVPPPPANQIIGINDGVFNNLMAADCRFCHEGDNPDVPVQGNCLEADGVTGSNAICTTDAECTAPETCQFGVENRHHLLYNSIVPSLSVVPYPQWNTPDGRYTCMSCHSDVFILERDCLVCHVQINGAASVHHLTPTAQGTDSPIGDPNVGDCTPCHGTLVDDAGDGHFIPDYDPTPRTPLPSGGLAFPFNSRGNGAGACDYCHDQDAIPPADPIAIFTNEETHHGTGLGPPVESPTSEKCAWCHDPIPGGPTPWPQPDSIRTCENCHGPDANHAIQADSDGDGVITPGIELPWFGHIGDPDDCWGCHGFTLQASSPGTGPVVPHISGSNMTVVTAGSDTPVVFTGGAFTNMSEGILLTSNVVLTAVDGSSTTLIPDIISENSLTVTIPGTTPVGNYDVRAVKEPEESNPIVLSIVPEVVITDVSCNRKRGALTITGSGFGIKPSGTNDYINVAIDGNTVDEADIISWSDTEIEVSVSSCPDSATVTVNATFGSATNSDSGGGDPPGGGACRDYTDKADCNADASCSWDDRKSRCRDADSGGNNGGGDPPAGDPEICDDGIDNDGDGKTDCADKGDCKRDPACA